MGVARNAGLTVVVTALLVGALLVLFPSSAGAVVAHMGTGDVSQIDASGKVRLAFDVHIAAGEHFPVDLVEVRAIQGGFQLDGNGRIVPSTGSWPCGGPVNTASAHAQLVSVVGRSATLAAFSAEGYTNVGYSGGYYTHAGLQTLGGLSTYSNGYGAGYGYGYGGGSAGVTIRVTVDLIGCTFFTNPAVFSNAFTFQAIVGANPLGTSASTLTLPITKTLVNPDFVAPPGTSTTVTADTSTSTSGATTSSSTILSSPTNQPLDAPTLADNQLLDAGNPSLGLPTVSAVRVTYSNVAGTTIPAGTEISMAHSTGAGGTLGAPAFGIDPTALASTTGANPLGYFRLVVSVPGTGTVDASTVLGAVEIDMCLPAASVVNPTTVQMRGFRGSDGGLKGTHPTKIAATLDTKGTASAADDERCFTFRITNFSSFAIIASIGGGGGIGNPTSTTNPTTATDTDGDGLPDAWELQHFGSTTGADPTGDADDDGLTNLVEFTRGTNPTRADTDGDGISDSDEILAGTNPLDANSPGTGTGTGSQTGTDSETGQLPGPKDSSRIPGFEIVALLAALGAVLVLRRRD